MYENERASGVRCAQKNARSASTSVAKALCAERRGAAPAASLPPLAVVPLALAPDAPEVGLEPDLLDVWVLLPAPDPVLLPPGSVASVFHAALLALAMLLWSTGRKKSWPEAVSCTTALVEAVKMDPADLSDGPAATSVVLACGRSSEVLRQIGSHVTYYGVDEVRRGTVVGDERDVCLHLPTKSIRRKRELERDARGRLRGRGRAPGRAPRGNSACRQAKGRAAGQARERRLRRRSVSAASPAYAREENAQWMKKM